MRTVGYSALALSVIGAVLDFASAYQVAPMSAMAMAGPYSAEVVLFALGVVVLAAGILPFLPSASWSMRRSGLSMEILGVAMAVVSGLVPGMDVALSYAMLVVGALMIVNGIAMQRGRREATM